MAARLFIGITSWNSALFLPHCIRATQTQTKSVEIDIAVLDNCSEDGSAELARKLGVRVIEERSTQPEALNRLISLSQAEYTLLIHADVILLHPEWYELCQKKLSGKVVLMSPEDIGCGPLTRPFGIGKPESSFMFWRTDALSRVRKTFWGRRFGIPLPRRCIDFYGPHITHALPAQLAAQAMSWAPMRVHWSDRLPEPMYSPEDTTGKVWSEELAFLRYGLGNFYSIDGRITHYHNWYDRVQSEAKVGKIRGEFPPGFIKSYTSRFLSDLQAGQIVLPPAVDSNRVPVAL